MNKIFLDKEFDKFWNKILRGENFTLLRYGDGERTIMCGESVTAQEGWQSPNYITKLGKSLLYTLNINEPNIYYGISCPCCDNKAYYWYSSRIFSKNITFANLWVNNNYPRFYKNFLNLKCDAVLIANYRAKNQQFGNLNILKHYEIGDDCIAFWEQQASDMIEQIKRDFGSRNDLLYVVSAGPMSEPIIVELYKNNPNNCYIDFGSAIDMFVHQKQTRPYMDIDNYYAKRNCWMYDPKTTNFDVSVVLSAYKRPENLKLQIEAIEKQTLKPKEILLFQDGIKDDYKIVLNDDLKAKFNIVEESIENKGVWARFNFAREKSSSKYVCIFDDDTIPGERWLENCLTEMHKLPGLYGTIGILLNKEEYNDNTYIRIGWGNPNIETIMVDFVGHSWFLEKEWINYLFEDTEQLQKYKICGEDMTLSFKLQENGINTYVPPHPVNSYELWGSQPEYAVKFGTDTNSLFLHNGWGKMTETFNLLIQKYGFKIIKKLNRNYYNHVMDIMAYHKLEDKNKVFRMQNIFSISNEHGNNIKRKVIRILGIRFKFRV